MPDPQVTLHVLHCDQGDILQSTGQASTHSSSRYSGQSNTELVKRGIHAFPWQPGGILQSTGKARRHSSQKTQTLDSQSHSSVKGVCTSMPTRGTVYCTHSYSRYRGQSNKQLAKRGIIVHFHGNRERVVVFYGPQASTRSSRWCGQSNKQLAKRGIYALPWQPGKGGGILRSTGQASIHSSR